MTTQRVALYSSVGDRLTHYEVDVENAALLQRETVSAPENVQYAWPHPSREFLYVVSSTKGPREANPTEGSHSLSAFRIDRDTGALQPHGAKQPLPSRPIHVSLDDTANYALTAYNNPSNITVHRINADGTVGAPVRQPENLEKGIFAHQVLMTPSHQVVILVTRGNNPAAGKPEDPGALKLFRFGEGALSNAASIAPNDGYGFGPRHLDFHPTGPWAYVSLERQNQLQQFLLSGDSATWTPGSIVDTLSDRAHAKSRQLSGTVHVHPNGKTLYIANRADGLADWNGKQVFQGGENNIAVYAIDPRTGKPGLLQHVEARVPHVRTFAMDPGGRILVAAGIKGLPVRDGDHVVDMPTGLSVFRVAADGSLDFVRKYDIDTSGKLQFWMGVVGLSPVPARK